MSEDRVKGLWEFLADYPGMSIRPMPDKFLTIKGIFEFSAERENELRITDSYRLQINVPIEFPKKLPTIIEKGNKIPQNGEFHVNPDGSLCLGAPLRLLWILSKNPTLTGYAEKCIVPYLYDISYKLKFGGPLPGGELNHGSPGELQDYVTLLGLSNTDQAKYAIQLLGMKKRIANKKPCPCGCGLRLGKCSFNNKLKEFRSLSYRSWFRSLCS